MVTDLLEPQQAKAAGQTGEAARRSEAKTERSVRPLISDKDLQQTTDIVSRAADTLAELAKRNASIQAEARQQLDRQRGEIDAAYRRNGELQAEVDNLQARMDEMAAEFQSRVVDLQSKLAAARVECEAKAREADLARQWLAYLSAEIRERLGDAPAKLEELARATRAGLRD